MVNSVYCLRVGFLWGPRRGWHHPFYIYIYIYIHTYIQKRWCQPLRGPQRKPTLRQYTELTTFFHKLIYIYTHIYTYSMYMYGYLCVRVCVCVCVCVCVLGVARYTDVTVRYTPRFGGHGSIRFRYNRKNKKSIMLGFFSFILKRVVQIK